MVRWLVRVVLPVRTLVVAAMAVLTLVSVTSAANAGAVVAIHLAQGERMLPDGGWSAACDTRQEVCLPHDESGPGDMVGLHHHHADFQFTALAASEPDGGHILGRSGVVFESGEAAAKPASLQTTDQPPKI